MDHGGWFESRGRTLEAVKADARRALNIKLDYWFMRDKVITFFLIYKIKDHEEQHLFTYKPQSGGEAI